MPNYYMDPNLVDERFDPDDDEPACCPRCDGEGWIVGECFEDTCCCADPELDHDYYPCPLCNPEGK